jgi:hypothetical protein
LAVRSARWSALASARSSVRRCLRGLRVTYTQPVVVGQALPENVTVYPVPQYQQYDYTIINNHRVIIDPRTRRIVRVVD